MALKACLHGRNGALTALFTAAVIVLYGGAVNDARAQQELSYYSENPDEARKIAYLIEAIDKSDVTFVRNGKEYDSARASEHMEYKIGQANGRIKTARQFIHYIASRSFMSGKPYWVKTPAGKTVKTKNWLLGKLYDYEEKTGDLFFVVPKEQNS